MKKLWIIFWILSIFIVYKIAARFIPQFLFKNTEKSLSVKPRLNQEGNIELPEDPTYSSLFKVQKINPSNVEMNLKAPATVIGRVRRSDGKLAENIVIFSSPELAGIYSNYIQNIFTIETARKNLERVKDLREHGAATGRELNDAETEFYNRKAVVAENEAKLIREGFSPAEMKLAKPGTIWLISDVPETELDVLHKGLNCTVEFPSFQGQKFEAKIDSIAEVLNIETRKARIRIVLRDNAEKIRPGMYGSVEFQLKHNGIIIPRSSLFSADARYFVFIKKSQRIIEKREVSISSQTEEMVEIEKGLQNDEELVITNVILLKGLSFGI
jgi:multidrug efflux pump subunit AcrA (membrane-fusion protein)